MEPKAPQPARRTQEWVDGIIQSFNLEAAPPVDERAKRDAVRRFAQLERALRRGRIEEAAQWPAAAFRRRFYGWLVKGKAADGRWSLAELEASPLFTDKERAQWSQRRNPGPSARFVFDLLSKRAAALFELMERSRNVRAHTEGARRGGERC
jgi:hypothetical protein